MDKRLSKAFSRRASKGSTNFVKGLVSFTALANLFVIVAAAYWLNETRSHYVATAEVATKNMAYVLAESTASLIDKVDIALLSVVDEFDQQRRNGQVSKQDLNFHISRVQSQLPNLIRSTGVVDAEGKGVVIADRGKSIAAALDVSQRDYFIKLRDSTEGALVISKPLLSQLTGQWAIVFARRLSNPDGSFAGLAYAGLPLENYNKIISSVDVGKDGVVTLRDVDLRLIARHPELKAAGIDVGSQTVSAELRALLAAGLTEGTYYTPTGSTDIPRTVSFHKIGNYPLFMITGLAESEYLAQWRAGRMKVAALVAFFFCVTLLLAWRVFVSWKQQKESELQLRTVIEMQPECVKLIAPDGSLMYMNRTGLDMIEADTEEQVIGTKMVGRVAPEYREAFTALGVRVNNGESGSLEFEIKGLKGGHRWLDTHAVPMRDSDGKVLCLLGVTRDITQKKQVAMAFQESQARFRNTLENAPIGMVVVSIDGRILEANSAICDFLGYENQELVTLSLSDITDPDDLQRSIEKMRSALDGAIDTYRIEKRYVRKGGQIVWAQVTASLIRNTENAPLYLIIQIEDIEERRRMLQELKKSEERFRTVADFTYDWEYWRGVNNEYIYITPSCERMTGYSQAELIADPQLTEQMVLSDDRAIVDNHLRDYKDDTQHTLDFRIVRKDGEIRWIAHSCNPIFGEEGNFLGRRVSNRDITARKLVEEQLEKLSQTDSLTGLANRRHFMILAEHELSRAVRYSGELSLLMMDIDHFKAVNDTYGHQTGDLVLQKLSRLCHEALREIDVIGRLGGEEFAILLPQTDRTQALEVAERLRQTIVDTEIPLENGLPLRVSVSLGATTFVGNVTNIDTLLDQADKALFEAKHQGRNRVCVYQSKNAASEPMGGRDVS